jgi:hypothetical protein
VEIDFLLVAVVLDRHELRHRRLQRVGLLLGAVHLVLGLDEHVPPQQHAVEPFDLVDEVVAAVSDADADVVDAEPCDHGPVVVDRALQQ